MIVAGDAQQARRALAALPRPLGFVPTMGAIHAGHLALIEAARGRCRTVAVSVFVNPLQFGPGEDFERYPRDEAGDRRAIEEAGADLLYLPSPQNMYPPGFGTSIDVNGPAARYEGAARPTHFRGVATVVTKLLNAIAPDVLVLGQKDAQQTAVLRRLVRDLDLPVEVQIVPTAREHDGLARSSRNVYLSPQERAAAPSLYEALRATDAALRNGASSKAACDAGMLLLREPGRWQYLDVVDALTFEPIPHLRPPAFVIGSAVFGKTRLIDNLYYEGGADG